MITLIVFGKHYFLIVFLDLGKIRLANQAVSKASTKRMKRRMESENEKVRNLVSVEMARRICLHLSQLKLKEQFRNPATLCSSFLIALRYTTC
jgi:hypothetical protein